MPKIHIVFITTGLAVILSSAVLSSEMLSKEPVQGVLPSKPHLTDAHILSLRRSIQSFEQLVDEYTKDALNANNSDRKPELDKSEQRRQVDTAAKSLKGRIDDLESLSLDQLDWKRIHQEIGKMKHLWLYSRITRDARFVSGTKPRDVDTLRDADEFINGDVPSFSGIDIPRKN